MTAWLTVDCEFKRVRNKHFSIIPVRFAYLEPSTQMQYDHIAYIHSACSPLDARILCVLYVEFVIKIATEFKM